MRWHHLPFTPGIGPAGLPMQAHRNTFVSTCLVGEPRHPQKQNKEVAEEPVLSRESGAETWAVLLHPPQHRRTPASSYSIRP